MKDTKQIVTEFLKYFTSAEVSNDILVLNFSTPQIIDFEDKLLRELKHEIDFVKVKYEHFSLVIGDLPVGMQSEVTDTISRLNVNKNWNFVLKSLRLLKDNGQALYLIEPSILFSKKGKSFLQ